MLRVIQNTYIYNLAMLLTGGGGGAYKFGRKGQWPLRK